MDSQFWVFCQKIGDAEVKAYVLQRQNLTLNDRLRNDEKFLRSRRGKQMRLRIMRNSQTELDDDDDLDPRDEVELLQMCVRDTTADMCGPRIGASQACQKWIPSET